MLCIGLMSGTSMDGVDAVALRLDGATMAVEGAVHRPYAPALRAQLMALNQRGGADELHHALLAANAVALAYAQAVEALRQACPALTFEVIGAHGQTVRHQPGAFDGLGYSAQLLNGALLAEASGLDVVCDFRSRDVAAGGQGAPLVPAFHAARFARADQDVAVLNLGGIANFSLLPAQGAVRGFDCGPGNLLLDLWAQRHLGADFDAGGAWGACGTVQPALLQRLLAEPYLALPPPKSTGRDLFDAAWLQARLDATGPLAPADVQATLTEFTARTAADALRRTQAATTRLLACGGGALNRHLMQRLQALLPAVEVTTTASEGLAVMHVEAAAFAWLAHAYLRSQPGNLPAVTGARGLRVLGALHRA